MIGAVAAYINNIGACITVGAIAGFVSGLWLRVIHPRFNSTSSSKIDQLGLVGPVLVNGFLGSFVVAPLVFAAYKQEGITVAELGGTVTNAAPATFYLAITFVTIALAILTGIIAAIICVVLRDPTDDYYFVKLVSNDYGLFREGPTSKIRGEAYRDRGEEREGGHTAAHLNRSE